jgi:hypothetical protein
MGIPLPDWPDTLRHFSHFFDFLVPASCSLISRTGQNDEQRILIFTGGRDDKWYPQRAHSAILFDVTTSSSPSSHRHKGWLLKERAIGMEGGTWDDSGLAYFCFCISLDLSIGYGRASK